MQNIFENNKNNLGRIYIMGFLGCSPGLRGYKGPPAPIEDNGQNCELKKKYNNLKF